MRPEEYFIMGQIVAICEAALAEEMGVIAASRKLSALGLQLFDGRDEDFQTFDGVDSETEDLPVDNERRNWSVESLETKDKEIAKCEAHYKEEVFIACKKILERFNNLRDGTTSGI